MPKSEIDEIFASKGKSKAIHPVAPPSIVSEKKRKKDKKKKRDLEAAEFDVEVMTKKQPTPETVVDPSTRLPSAKRAKVSTIISKNPLKSGGKDSSQGDEDRFKDSRGSGLRKCNISFLYVTRLIPSRGRKTEEGFSIFKEDELGIGDEGGGETDFLVRILSSPIYYLQTRRCVRLIVNAVCLLFDNRPTFNITRNRRFLTER